jgi:hypothetical protein
MNDTQTTDTSFGGFFGSMWRIFKGNYGLCLGMGILMLVVMLIATTISGAVGFALGASKDPVTGGAVKLVLDLGLQILVVMPFAYWIAMRITQRVRGTSGLRAGWYGRAVPLLCVYIAFMLPGLIVASVADPDHYHADNNPVVKIQNAIEEATAGDDYVAPVGDPDDEAPRPVNVGLQIAAGVLLIVGILVVLPWVPWATMSAIDPEESTSGVGECLARGRELGRGAAGAMIGSYIVIVLILGVTLTACIVPGLFFGLPLAMGWTPAVYLALRGNP